MTLGEFRERTAHLDDEYRLMIPVDIFLFPVCSSKFVISEFQKVDGEWQPAIGMQGCFCNGGLTLDQKHIAARQIKNPANNN